MIDPLPAILDLSAAVADAERRGCPTLQVAHLRHGVPRGKCTRLTPTSGPFGLFVRADLERGGRYLVTVQYQTRELRMWVDEQLEKWKEGTSL